VHQHQDGGLCVGCAGDGRDVGESGIRVTTNTIAEMTLKIAAGWRVKRTRPPYSSTPTMAGTTGACFTD
jgi:hypothetical protein